MRADIRFLLGHEPRTLSTVDPTMTVLDYLRQVEGLKGTKEGCNEGDCGACTVVLARATEQGLHYEAVNACIQFVGTLDGCQLLTVEHLAESGPLHPIQQAMVDCHASQCGFCTPGFVMSLFAMTRDHESVPDEQTIDDTLAGNLCRCTGYAPIVRAAQRAYQNDPHEDSFRQREAQTLAALRSLPANETVVVPDADGNRRFFSPGTVEDLAALYESQPDATLVAGSTDVGLWVTKEMRRLESVIYLGRVAALKEIKEDGEAIEIGAGASYSDAMALLARHYPDMGEVIRRIGSVQIRNAGTLGGNVANGSPIGDSPPLLIAAGATVQLRKGGATRVLPLEDFFIAYGQQDRAPGEFVERILVPKPNADTRFRAYKVAKRFDQDITAVLGAYSLGIEDGRVTAARLAYGGMAATPKRATAAEAALVGQAWTETTIERAMAALDEDFAPISDWRASADYRRLAAKNLLRRCFIELNDETVVTRLVGAGAA